MARDLEEILLAFFYTDKVFLSRFVAEGDISWVRDEYKKLFSVIKDYYTRHGELATMNVVGEKVTKTEDILFYKNLITSAKQLKVERADYPHLIDKLKERRNKLLIDCALKEMRTDLEAQKPVDEVNLILQKANTEVANLYRSHAYREASMQESAKECFQQYIMEAKNPDSIKGHFTGVAELDRITNGLRPPDFFLIVGESGTGKSIFAMNIAINLWLGENKIEQFGKDYKFKDGGCNILYFSIEMDYENMRQRIDSNLAEIDYYRLRDRQLTKSEFERYKRSSVFQSKYDKQFVVTDIPRGLTIADIKATYEKLHAHFKPDVLVVDHLGLMRPTESRGADWLEMGDIAADLHEFNRRHGTITIAAVQANRAKAANGKKMHGTNRIGRSEIIPQNASIILEIANREDEETFSDMPIYITKMRNGERGHFVMYKRFSVMRVVDEGNLM